MLPICDHARFEMERRGITEEMIKDVYDHPEQKIRVTEGREIWQNKIELGEKSYVLRLVVDLKPTRRIVTVYKSSKASKYWRDDS